MRLQEFNSASMTATNNTINLIIDCLGGRLAVIAWSAGIAATGEWTSTLAKRDGTEFLAHTPPGYHLTSQGCNSLQIVLRTRGDTSNHHLFGSTSTEGGNKLCQLLSLGVIIRSIQ